MKASCADGEAITGGGYSDSREQDIVDSHRSGPAWAISVSGDSSGQAYSYAEYLTIQIVIKSPDSPRTQ